MRCKFAQELKRHPLKATLVDCIDVISFPLPFNVKNSSLEDKANFPAPIPVLHYTSLACHSPCLRSYLSGFVLPFSIPAAHAPSSKMRQLSAQSLKSFDRLHLQLHLKNATQTHLECDHRHQHISRIVLPR